MLRKGSGREVGVKAQYSPPNPPSPRRSPRFPNARPRSRDRAVGPPSTQNALNTRPVTPADAQGGSRNRWSKSTNSSTHSHTHKRSNSSATRLSVVGVSSFLDTASPPRAPPKPLPSDIASSTSHNHSSRPPHHPPAVSVPPKQAQRSLHIPYKNSSAPLNGPAIPSPSTAHILSDAARHVDYFGKGWEDSSLGPKDFAHRSPPAAARSASLGPSPVLHSAFSTDGAAYRRQPGEDGQGDRPRARGHSRHLSQTTKSSTSSNPSPKQVSQKAMLSKALQKANTAVLLDNAQNFEGAMQAYSEACALLQQVMLRSSGDDDRRKLEAIRNTYTSRISELKNIAPHLDEDGKASPAQPKSGERRDQHPRRPELNAGGETATMDTATATPIGNNSPYAPELHESRSPAGAQLPRRRDSLRQAGSETLQYRPQNLSDQYGARAYSKSPMRERIVEAGVDLAPPLDNHYMPPPLSPRRPASPPHHGASSTHPRPQSSGRLTPNLGGLSATKGHTRAASNESMSWLDTIDESGDSTASSVHSRTSSMRIRRKYIRAPSGAAETEFDTALDAAIEAAYDEGFEPTGTSDPIPYDYDGDDDEIVAQVRRKVERAKERVRETERDARIHTSRDAERERALRNAPAQLESPDDEYDANESEEEERMLEEMTRDYVMDDFEFGLQSKSALPRESDSSGFSGRTWKSSIGSDPTTAGTSLSTVTETSTLPRLPVTQTKTTPPLHPPPSQALPPPPNPGPQQHPVPAPSSVRSRRLSGQNAKQLKIETKTRKISLPPPMPPPRLPEGSDPIYPKTAGLPRQLQPSPAASGRLVISQSARQFSSPFPGAASPTEILSPPTPTLHHTLTNESDQGPLSDSPGGSQSRGRLRKNFSSSSLKNMKSRNLSVSNVDDGGSDISPITPSTAQFHGRDPNGKLPAIPALPTPMAAAFMEKTSGMSTGGMYLFNGDTHSPESPGSPNPLGAGAPVPLEPCPTEYLLRPFWLMRALYQTISHPRGGYLSTKLLVPRDVWRVKGVKIKGVEDKIANCDLLTAALTKLARVDTLDADAVLEEMQALEGVFEQAQVMLSKKLGNDVGIHGSGGMFKDASVGAEPETSNVASKSSSMSSKSSSFSWRRLRPKNSGAALSSAYASKVPTDGPREGLTMATLPMTSTSVSKVRFAKRDVSQLQFSGPNANYMGALARLFEAAQTIDQIARQVEDPGLRHADKTQVGLELCTRHAAEFFGFYICRFVLQDVALLLDKFIKRGSEWVNV
ncbi:MIT domain-containing protein [Diplocarpon rosae]|nr:MIT domain-containing protein [Diplocarpon rosae]